MLEIGERPYRKVNGSERPVLPRSTTPPPLRTPAALPSQDPNLQEEPRTLRVVPSASPSQQHGNLDLVLHGRQYQARWAENGSIEHLRVNLRVKDNVGGADRMHVETLDLYSPRSRRVFAARTAHLFGATIDVVE